MNMLEKCNNIFIDFDGVIVYSNKFKELAIERSIIKISGRNQLSEKAIIYFNINAGISRKKKLSLFFEEKQVEEIMKIYAEECNKFFIKALPSQGFRNFLTFIKENYKKVKIYILSGGEQKEIEIFLKKNLLLNFFQEILDSAENKSSHLKKKQVSGNDIFIGDSLNDLKASIESGTRFILFEEHKSLKSFPSEDVIKNNVYLRTTNFTALMNQIIS